MKPVFIVLLLAITIRLPAQGKLSPGDSLLPGVWKGNSICQIKSSPCHDEIAVYHISSSGKPNLYHMLMNKLVNGVEEEMGTLDYIYDPAGNSLTSIDEKHKTTWRFTVKGKNMEGTLVYQDKLYRVIKLKKESP